MLRSGALLICMLLVSTAGYSQILVEIPGPERNASFFDRVNFNLPGWAEPFADSTVKKALIPGQRPALQKSSSLPPGVRPIDYIGRDGLPGDPLPAVHFMDAPRNVLLWEKVREFMVDPELERRVKEAVSGDKK